MKRVGFLFDLDGVIIDSEAQYSKIWRQIDDTYPTGIPSFEKVIKGCTLTKILNENYPDPEIRGKVCEMLHYLENRMVYEYKEGSKEFLVSLSEKGIPASLVTSSDEEKMSHLQEQIPELFDFFDFIVTANLVKTSKPSPEGYLLGASKIGTDPSHSVVFEDSLQGVMAGRKAGAYVVGVKGTIPVEHLETYSDLIIDSLSEIDLEKLIHEVAER